MWIPTPDRKVISTVQFRRCCERSHRFHDKNCADLIQDDLMLVRFNLLITPSILGRRKLGYLNNPMEDLSYGGAYFEFEWAVQ